MSATLVQATDSFAAYRLTGKLKQMDYQLMIPQLKRRIETHGKISLYIEFEDFDGWTPSALWEDLRFDAKHMNDFTRIAIVGESRFQEAISKLAKPLTSADIRFFKPTDRETALDWSKSGEY